MAPTITTLAVRSSPISRATAKASTGTTRIPRLRSWSRILLRIGGLAQGHRRRQDLLGVDDHRAVPVQVGEVADRLQFLEGHLDIRGAGFDERGVDLLAVLADGRPRNRRAGPCRAPRFS